MSSDLSEAHAVVAAKAAIEQPVAGSIRHAALCFESALYFALEEQGHRVAADGVVINGEVFVLTIEGPRQIWIREAEKEAVGGGKETLLRSVRLTLVVRHLERHRAVSRWSYWPARESKPQLKRLLQRFESAIEDVRRSRAWDRKEERRIRRMAARYRWDLAASERPERLRQMTEAWHEASRMRAFLAAFDVYLQERPSDALATWIGWARHHVEEHDPFTASNMTDLGSHAALLAKPKRGRPEPDEEELRELGFLDEYL